MTAKAAATENVVESSNILPPPPLPPNGLAMTPNPIDPFDPASLRLSVTPDNGVNVKRLLTTVPVRKPKKQEWVRVHPDPQFRLSPAGIIEYEKENYLVLPHLASELAGEYFLVTL
jgi:hypothetical protein